MTDNLLSNDRLIIQISQVVRQLFVSVAKTFFQITQIKNQHTTGFQFRMKSFQVL